MKLNVLISCSGKQVPLIQSFIDALDGQGKVFAADMNRYASSMAVADHSLIGPEYSDNKFKDWVLMVCDEYKIGLWISLMEKELIVLEELRGSMKKLNCTLVGAPVSSINNALDKYKYKSFLDEYGIKVPETWKLSEVRDNNIQDGDFIIKNRFGRGSRGIVKVCGLMQLSSIARDKEYSENWIAQRMIAGQVYCIDVINDLENNFVASLIRKRLVMGEQETDVAETLLHEGINRLASQLSAAIGHQGVMDVDIIENGNELLVIDINLRFGGSHIFSQAAGANIPAALIAWKKGQEPDPEWLKHRIGEVITRFSSVALLRSNTEKIKMYETRFNFLQS